METENLDDFCKNQNLNFDNVPTKINNYADFKYFKKLIKKQKTFLQIMIHMKKNNVNLSPFLMKMLNFVLKQ